ncbi:CBS domain-containing protein [Aggregicoccus sp. 17bor-14]|uniref:CBS domain-containing protein n=1 Tax=Myxococcaceae TaxID=31 RepID=UPI00129CDAD4|nr:MULTISPECIES: CBS domain-containing protein [Myxococcaceae]MBF5040761.1 CBS domain-containing protein [Simulacricoccus sp. 17bor-14]MRI86549.1 CBS domain-containing protein [Aggregicoccus sp. 17bor-14]
MSLFVRELMLRDVAVLEPRTPLREAAAAMARSPRGLLVIADEDRIHGLVTLRQLVFGAEAAAQGHPVHGVGDLAHPRFLVTWEREPLEELAARLVQAGVRCAVVLGEGGGVAGLITTLELANAAKRRRRGLRAVDVASEDSFPASDAPSWTGALAG